VQESCRPWLVTTAGCSVVSSGGQLSCKGTKRFTSLSEKLVDSCGSREADESEVAAKETGREDGSTDEAF
jgi:hypothetical protein